MNERENFDNSQNDKKFLGLLGLCRRSRNVSLGTQDVCAAARDGRAKLVLVASDASLNTTDKIKSACKRFCLTPITLHFTKSTLGAAVGISEVSAAAVTDEGLAGALSGMIKFPETEV